jgi:DNA-binding transcriptional ArsR family regulator
VDRKPIEFRLTPGDISAIRFGLSPGMELAGAVRTLVDPRQHPLHWGWVRGVREHVPAAAFQLLGALIGGAGYLPDFLTSTPGWDLTPDVELARLRKTDLGGIRRDLHKVIVRSSGARRAIVEQLAADPAQTRTLVANAWEEVWQAVLDPQWRTLERLLRADIGSRARRISEHGLAAMVATLDDQVSWLGDSVLVAIPTHSQVIDCTGTGLMLVPSVFRRSCGVVGDAPAHPMLFYPAHGISETWHGQAVGDGAALGSLLGDGRARVLSTLTEPLSTSETARACELAVSTASHHLTVLRDAGLVTSRRVAQMVLHARTPIGDALVAAPTGHRASVDNA